jgi:hypothetical protein
MHTPSAGNSYRPLQSICRVLLHARSRSLTGIVPMLQLKRLGTDWYSDESPDRTGNFLVPPKPSRKNPVHEIGVIRRRAVELDVLPV